MIITSIRNDPGAGGVAQVADCLISKTEALSSNPRTAKKKKKGRNKRNDSLKI
jgi:hypothetical protein